MSDYIAKVIKILDEYTVVINKGSKDNISEGQKFLLLGVGEEIIDPDTNENLGHIELVRGKVIVQHVQERMATLTSDKWAKSGGSKIVRRQNPIYGILRSEEVETVSGKPELLPLDSPEIGDVIKLI